MILCDLSRLAIFRVLNWVYLRLPFVGTAGLLLQISRILNIYVSDILINNQLLSFQTAKNAKRERNNCDEFKQNRKRKKKKLR